MQRLQPNFLVVGAAKAGTSSLHDYLGQHPQVFMSRYKEPHFFTRDWGFKKWEEYEALFVDATGKDAVGESSAGYLYSEESPSWIRSVLGEIKIIILLRQPARRALSAYAWMVREGYEDASTFPEALNRETVRLQDQSFRRTCLQFYPDYLYFTMGLYAEQVERYLEVFGHDQVRIYLFEEFVADPIAVCHDLFRFLRVRDDFVPRVMVHNKGRIPAFIGLQHWIRTKAEKRFPFLPQRLRNKLIRETLAWNVRRGGEPELDKQLERTLMDRYRNDVHRLERLLDRDLSRWFDVSGASAEVTTPS